MKMNNDEKVIIDRVRYGKFLKQLRLNKGLTITNLGDLLGISGNYVSELERGMKVPSDHLIMKIAEFHGIDENEVFEGFGKVPLLVRQEFENNKSLQKALLEVAQSKKLSEEQKERIYDQAYHALRELIRSEEGND